MRIRSYLTALVIAAALAACSTDSKAPASGDAGGGSDIPAKSAKAAKIANEIAANPNDAEAVLERHGMTATQFEALMYEIAEDEELSEAYERARR